MKNEKSIDNRITSFLTLAGSLLIIGTVLLTIFQLIGQSKTLSENRDTVEKLYNLIPTVHSGAQEDRVDMNMPALEMDGENFIGIIEIPFYEITLPVCGSWNKHKISSFPCRYYGNLYDSSLIIGGSDAEGHFDFIKTTSVGDAVFVTDMTGGQYFYQVEWIEKYDEISGEVLMEKSADLVLFTKNTYSFDYTVVFCSMR
ncbi:MAG: hypothetical protein IKU40_10735 [Clostridia bacterium]|nr:hypothetical protein [Clostridia bacterium]